MLDEAGQKQGSENSLQTPDFDGLQVVHISRENELYSSINFDF